MSEYIFDYSKLLGKIKEVCKTQAAFARKMGMSLSGLSARLHNKQDFDAKEICLACEILHIAFVDIPIYFFTRIVQKHEPINA